MIETTTSTWLPRADLDRLIALLREDGRKVVGPTIRDSAIVYDEIDAARVARAMVHDAWIGPPTKHFWASNLQTANGSCREWHTGQVGLGSVLNNDGTLRLLPCSIPRRVACCG